MVRSSKGFRSRTRNKLKQAKKYKFKSETFLKSFNLEDRVVITINPSSQKGMPFPKMKGRIGSIIEKRGNSYIVKVKIGNKEKSIISRPEHLKKI